MSPRDPEAILEEVAQLLSALVLRLEKRRLEAPGESQVVLSVRELNEYLRDVLRVINHARQEPDEWA